MYFTVKPQEGIVATSFKPGDKVFIGGDKLLPLEKYVTSIIQIPKTLLTRRFRFLPKPKGPPGKTTFPTAWSLLWQLLTHDKQVLRLSALAVLEEAVPVVVVEALPEDAEVPEAEVSVVVPEASPEAVAVEVPAVVVASREVVAVEPLVVVEASVARQSLSCLVLSYYGVWGNRELCRNLLFSTILCILGKIAASLNRGCRIYPAIESMSYDNKKSCQSLST